MNATSTTSPGPAPGKASLWPAIVYAGLVCGVMDIGAAFINAGVNGATPLRVLRAIASALLGADAYQGGWPVAVLGLGMHFLVAFTVAAVFGGLSHRFPLLTRHAGWSGLVYGAGVYLVMNLAVLPLAAQFRGLYLPATKPFVPNLNLIGLGIHLLCVGLPIAFTVRRFAPAGTVGPRDRTPMTGDGKGRD